MMKIRVSRVCSKGMLEGSWNDGFHQPLKPLRSGFLRGCISHQLSGGGFGCSGNRLWDVFPGILLTRFVVQSKIVLPKDAPCLQRGENVKHLIGHNMVPAIDRERARPSASLH